MIATPGIRSKMAILRTQLAHLPRTFGLFRIAAGTDLMFWSILLIVQGLLPAGLVLLSKQFVDALTAAIRVTNRNQADLASLAVLGGGIATLLLAIEALRVLATWLRARLASAVEDHFNDLIHAKSTEVDLAFYDTPEQHDRLRLQPEVLRQLMDSYPYQLKFVVSAPEDLAEIRAVVSEVSGDRERVLLMPEGTDPATLAERGRWLVELCKQEGFRYSPRLHIDLWGNRRGV